MMPNNKFTRGVYDATDFGDLLSPMQGGGACSSAHGGLS